MTGQKGDAGGHIVGRERELVALREALDHALAGQGGLVLIGGAAGLGKTTLAEAICREAAGRGALVLTGRCYDLSETPPYGQWAEALTRAPRGDELPALPTAVLPPEREGEALSGQDSIIRRVQAYLTALATRQPLVLLLDDLHWADPASLDLLRVVARGLADLPLLLLVTYRADEVAGDHPLATLLPALVRESRAERLNLHALEEADLHALLRQRYTLPADDERRLAAHLRSHAEGNPLYIGELLRALEEARTLARDHDAWHLGDPSGTRVPTLLRQVIESRLSKLGAEAEHLLSLAAVIGQVVPFSLWATVADTDEGTAQAVVERASGARIAEEIPDGTGMRFAHALIRETLYEGLTPSRRRAIHRQIGEALVASPQPDPDAIAYHFQRSGDPRAAEWLERAAERAFRAYAWPSAAARLEAALPLLEAAGADAGERAWLLYRAARLRRISDPVRGLRLLSEAARLLAHDAGSALAAYVTFERGLARGNLGNELSQTTLADMAAGIAALDALSPADRVVRGGRDDIWLADALTTGSAPTGAAQAVLSTAEMNIRLGTFVMWLGGFGRFTDARVLGERVHAETASHLPNNVFALISAADAFLGLGFAHAAQGQPTAARAAFQQSARLNWDAGHYWLAATALSRILDTVALVYDADNPAAHVSLIEEIERALAGAGMLFAQRDAPKLYRLPLLYLAGDWAEALAFKQAGQFGNVWLAPITRAQGNGEQAWEIINAWFPAGPTTEPGGRMFFLSQSLQRLAAALALDVRNLPLAREWLTAHDHWLAWSEAIPGRSEGVLGWAAYHRVAGDLTAAREHAERALAHATEPRQPLALLAAHHLLGELDTAVGRHADAATHLDAALALADACAARYERALCLLARAELRAAFPAGKGSTHEASSDLDEARATLAELGAAPAMSRADALAARLTAPVAAPAALPFGLTAREAEVLRLVAEGLTDPQMAERLFVSRNTINAHLRAIYGKLGVNTRAAAARLALEHGLA